MKRIKPILKFLALTITIVLVCFIALNGYVFHSSTICPSAYLASYLDKVAWLQEAPSPRIIFVGDSNLTNTLGSELIAEEFDYTPVNMSISQSIGLRYDLDSIRPEIREGDVVVVSTVFDQLIDNTESFNSSSRPLLWGLLTMRPQDVQFLTSWTQVEHVIDTNLEQLGKRWEDSTLLNPECLTFTGTNRVREKFNQYGDYIGHLGEDSLVKNGNQFTLDTAELDGEAIEFLNTYADFVESQGAHIYFTYSPYSEGMWDNSEDNILAFHANMVQQLNFPVIGDPSDYYLPSDLLYDSIYHGTAQGRIQRTEQFIEDIRPYLESQ